jgi:thiosulfate reductase cytochrome b subunit
MPEEGISIERRHWIYRHTLTTRVTHWINALCLLILLLSGLQIFNAHPALYVGMKSDFEAPILEMKTTTAENIASGAALRSAQSLTRWAAVAKSKEQSENTADEDDSESDQPAYRGAVTVFGRLFDTTGWLGYAYGPDGQLAFRGFPSAVTLPGKKDLATGRRWHFTFAWLLVLNGLVYLAFAIATGHIRRDLWASAPEWRDIPHEIWQHMRLRFPKGDEARRYNVLQKLAYLTIIFIVIPVMVLTGMTMSPGLDALFPFLAPMFGGRQTARTIHFIFAFGLVAFVFIHVALVILSGFANNMRSMITGRYVIASRERELHEPTHPASS